MVQKDDYGRERSSAPLESIKRRSYLKAVTGATAAGFGVGSAAAQTATPTTSRDQWPDLSGQSVHLLIDETGPQFREVFNQMAADFTQATGAQVNNEFAGVGTSAQRRLTSLIQAGDPPEIYAFIGSEATTLANEGAITPVNEVVEYWHERWGETPENLRIQIEGDDYVVPVSSKGGVLWYRSDIWGEAPTDTDTLLSLAEENAGTEGMDAFTILLAEDLCSMFNWMCLLKSHNINLARRQNGEIQVALDQGDNGDRMVALLEYMRELSQYSHHGGDLGCDAMSNDVATEVTQASIHTVSRPKAGAIDNGHDWAPDLHGVIPPSPSAERNQTWGNVEGLSMFPTENQEAATEFLKFIAEPSYLINWFSIVPFQFQPIQPGMTETEEWQSFVNGLPDAWSQEDIDIAQHRNYSITTNETEPPNPYAGTFINSFAPVKAAFQVIENDADPREALTAASDELRSSLNEVRG